MSDRGDTVLMEIAGAGHVHMFQHWYRRILHGRWTCKLDVVNVDGRNLYSIAGLAHEKGRRAHANHEIKTMVRYLTELGQNLTTTTSCRSISSRISLVRR